MGDRCWLLSVQKVGCEVWRQEKKILNDRKKNPMPVELELSMWHFVIGIPVLWVLIRFHMCIFCKESSVMWKSEFLALWEKLWDHSFSFLVPLIATILLIISETVGYVFMTSYLEYSVRIKYVRSIERIFLPLFWCFIKAVLNFWLSKGIPTTK